MLKLLTMARASAGVSYQAIEPNHAFDRFLPAFGRGSLPGDPAEIALVILGVTAAAFRDDQRIGDGNAFFERSRRCSRPLSAALCQYGNREQENGEGSHSKPIRLRYRSSRPTGAEIRSPISSWVPDECLQAPHAPTSAPATPVHSPTLRLKTRFRPPHAPRSAQKTPCSGSGSFE